MGFAIARAAAEAGAKVTLIAGPVGLATPEGVMRVDVVSAEDMFQASQRVVETGCDIFVATAAVADYRPVERAYHKIKKKEETLTLSLVRTPDIVAMVATHARRPFTVGFAAETRDVINYAKGKLEKKRLDMIATNDVSRTDIGFNSDNNALTVIWPEGHQVLPLAGKAQIARQLLELIAAHLH
jgi:phosphopantothenoylcysteine decarboxylase/phosphopantothenate--cysteine ligase